MPGRHSIITCLSVWIGLAGMGAIAWADAPQVLPGQGVGVMGQVARPGTYVFDSPRLPLSDLIREAGGLTQRATGRLRVVRPDEDRLRVAKSLPADFSLQPGDIVIAEGEPSAAEETYQQMALIRLIDWPVILPVPTTHANLPAILDYLGQDPGIARQVHVVPGGVEQAMTRISGPAILDFQSAAVQRLRLPRFPEVYRIEPMEWESEWNFAAVQHEEPDSADSDPPMRLPALTLSFPDDSPRPPERFQRPGTPALSPEEMSGPVLKPLSDSEAREELRPLEPVGPVPDVSETPWEMEVPRFQDKDSEDTRLAGKAEEENPKKETASSARWPWVGLVMLALVCGGIYAKRFWGGRFSGPPMVQSIAATIPLSVKPVPLSPDLPEPPAEEGMLPEDVFPGMDDALAALLLNTLPLVEETWEAAGSNRAETKPSSPPQLRMDSPHEPAAKRPHLLNRSPKPTIKLAPPATAPPKSAKPQTAQQEIDADTDTNTSEKNEPPDSSTLGVLDRVLQRVHERRAA